MACRSFSLFPPKPLSELNAAAFSHAIKFIHDGFPKGLRPGRFGRQPNYAKAGTPVMPMPGAGDMRIVPCS